MSSWLQGDLRSYSQQIGGSARRLSSQGPPPSSSTAHSVATSPHFPRSLWLCPHGHGSQDPSWGWKGQRPLGWPGSMPCCPREGTVTPGSGVVTLEETQSFSPSTNTSAICLGCRSSHHLPGHPECRQPGSRSKPAQPDRGTRAPSFCIIIRNFKANLLPCLESDVRNGDSSQLCPCRRSSLTAEADSGSSCDLSPVRARFPLL